MQTQWPLALRDYLSLEPYFDRAAWELHARIDPCDWTCKMRSQRLAAERLRDEGCHYEAAALTIMRSFQGPNLPILNRQGMIQRDCLDCGDCLTGCNVGAKNTLAMNYLPWLVGQEQSCSRKSKCGRSKNAMATIASTISIITVKRVVTIKRTKDV